MKVIFSSPVGALRGTGESVVVAQTKFFDLLRNLEDEGIHETKLSIQYFSCIRMVDDTYFRTDLLHEVGYKSYNTGQVYTWDVEIL
jgi:hypothetical protein